MSKLWKKIPWGIIAGACGILCFYLTAAVIGVNFVFAQVNGQTGQVATIFDTWWQTLMFVCDVVFGIIFVGSIASFIAKKKLMKRGVGDNE